MGQGIGSSIVSYSTLKTNIKATVFITVKKRGDPDVSQDEIQDFITSINRLYSVSGISLILLNIIPGFILDYSKNHSKTIGVGLFKGYCVLMTASFIFNTAASIMQGFQNTTIGKFYRVLD